MATATATTTLADIHPHVIQTHILPRLDGPSLSTTATTSPFLQNLCSDLNLWSHVSKSTWPSITDPRVDDVISTFPAGHRSFFKDSFPALITHVDHPDCRRTWSPPQPDCPASPLRPSSHAWPSDLISGVDVRYQNDIIYSRVEFTDATPDFLSSPLRIELNDDPTSKSVPEISRSIDLKVDELAGADHGTLSHLKESLTLNWILIDPTRKRAGNLSSIKAVSARQDWMSNETVVRYVTVLPAGRESEEMVQCRMEVLLGVGKGGVGLHVKEVTLKLLDLDCRCLNGSGFMAVVGGAVMEENKSVRRKVVVDEEERWRSYREFKEMKREKREWVKKAEEKKELEIKMNYVGIFVSFFCSLYFLVSML